MSPLILIAVTAVIFLVAEAIMLPNVMRPLFQSIIGPQMLDGLRLGPAALFYIVHIGGLTWFATLPALRDGLPVNALINGALLGLVAYGCYEFTSWTIMKDWSIKLVVADILWGMIISGVSAWVAVLVARAVAA
jgi:uncharacterized membrane protein